MKTPLARADDTILIDPQPKTSGTHVWGTVIIDGQEQPITDFMVRRACEQVETALVFPFDSGRLAANSH